MIKKVFYFSLICGLSHYLNAQVGIGTDNPQATLHIVPKQKKDRKLTPQESARVRGKRLYSELTVPERFLIGNIGMQDPLKLEGLKSKIEDNLLSVDNEGLVNKTAFSELINAQGLARRTELTGLARRTELTGLARRTELEGLARRTELEGLARRTELEGLARRTELTGLARRTELTGLARRTELEGLARRTELEGLARRTELEGLARKTELTGLARKTELTGLVRRSELSELVRGRLIHTMKIFARNKVIINTGQQQSIGLSATYTPPVNCTALVMISTLPFNSSKPAAGSSSTLLLKLNGKNVFGRRFRLRNDQDYVPVNFTTFERLNAGQRYTFEVAAEQYLQKGVVAFNLNDLEPYGGNNPGQRSSMIILFYSR